MRTRRDPRSEREGQRVSGSARVRFDRTRSSARRPRRDPRAEHEGFIVARGRRLRLDRTQAGPTPVPRAIIAPTPGPGILRLDEPAFLVLVIADPAPGPLGAPDKETLAAARILAGREGAVVLAAERRLEGAGHAGADRFLLLPPLSHPARRADAVSSLIDSLKPLHILCPETPEGGDLARRLAAETGEPLFAGAEQVSPRGLVRAVRSRAIDQFTEAPPRFITVAPHMLAPCDGSEREALFMDMGLPSLEDTPVETGTTGSAGVALAEADFVAAAGNGIRDFEAFRALANRLGAAAGASRVVCDAGLMPREAQVGASGTVLAASCYLALGIAGAPQHLQGIGACEHVIAVNTDLHAAMVERAELAIVADAHPVMEALLRLLRERERA